MNNVRQNTGKKIGGTVGTLLSETHRQVVWRSGHRGNAMAEIQVFHPN